VDLQTVVSEPDVRGKGGLGGLVVEVVTEMSEEGALRLEPFDEGDRAIEMGMTGVRIATERVENEDVEILKEGQALGGDVAHVGEVGGCAESISGDLLLSVEDRDAAEAGSEELCSGTGGRVDAVKLHTGAGGVAIFPAKGVLEDALDGSSGLIIGVKRKAAGHTKAEGPEVIEAHDVIRVAVGVEDGVYVADLLAHSLGVEVGAGVDEDYVIVVGETDGRPGAAIARVGGGADRALAAEGRHTHGRTAAQEREGRPHELEDDAWLGGGAGLGGGGSGESLRDLEEGHPQLEESAFEELDLLGA